MKNLLLTGVAACAFVPALVHAVPSVPILDWAPQNYAFVNVDLEGTGGYTSIVTRVDNVTINIKWNAWSGDGGDNYKVYFDDNVVNSGTLAPGSKTGEIQFSYSEAGRHTLYVALCEGDECVKSEGKPIVIADTDGAHLAPLEMNYDPNNNNYGLKDGVVTAAYFVEWGIYGRDFDVTKIPAQNLSHIIYGFIPICGPNDSLTGGPKQALVRACQGSQQYEVVIHDPWAAIQTSLPGIDASDPIRGTYAQLMALKQRYPELKILPSIGGWTLSDPFYGFTNKDNRDTFVASVKTFLQTWKFYDGVDIDWEYPGGQGANPNLGDPVNDGAAYVALMQELRAMLDDLEAETGRTYELTSAIGAGYDKIEDVNYAQAVQHMDYLFLMTYDFYGAWSNVTGHQTALYCAQHFRAGQCDGSGIDENGVPYKGPAYTAHNGVNLLLAQNVPADKIVLGAAMYGRGWEGVFPDNATDPNNPMTAIGNGPLRGTTEQGVWENGVIDYKGIKAFMLGANNTGINGFETGYDQQAKAAYVWNKTSGKLITYDSPDTVKLKGEYVKERGLAGIFAWEIDADNGDILNAMHEGLNGVPTQNRAPIVNVTQTLTLASGQSTIVNANATDPDGDALTYLWQFDSPLMIADEMSNAVTISAPLLDIETQSVGTVTVSDGELSVTKSITVTVLAEGTPPNTAPVIAPIEDISLNEREQISIQAIATDAENDPLTFAWSVPTGLTLQGQGEQVQILASEVNETTQYTIQLQVSDGQLLTDIAFTVTVNNVSLPDNLWQPDRIYTTGDEVLYEGLDYRAKWWTQGEQPDEGGPWERISAPSDTPVWQPSTVYVGGDKVIHNGMRYQANWWTQGEEPGVASVWQALND
ncbi:glycosyl hydrolase family 18 protein [Aestuariibacter sp. AA17]|uniref:chitinase n=1 Tax=Fluctibacter corallii TaxID=2984329 RepID=A0ABT3A6C5_9ALTE|nr:glycosyl hydrolase family 18 protein [Aestuariibacter sp. AA17]MCV2884165.1 glycosyl hydrolase family 18 protein [Aestuariibacter sp. AA17]